MNTERNRVLETAQVYAKENGISLTDALLVMALEQKLPGEVTINDYLPKREISLPKFR